MSETQPLLPSPPGAIVRKTRPGTIGTRFLAYVTFGVLIILTANLVFLPRTSLHRDWFRIHHNYITDADVQQTLFEAIDEQEIRSFAEAYTKTPHLAGQGLDLVNLTKSKFEEYGLKTEVVQYYTYLNYPLDHSLALLHKNGTVKFKASLEEDVLKEDPTTGLENRIPTFHGYGANGNVTAKFVYANYGRKEDFDALVEKGVEIKDKIVIVRYNRIFRGLKVKFAEEHGAVGVLIYSDPSDDAGIDFAHGLKPYPEGPARNPSSVQRGSVMFLSDAPGDPTTPGYPSTKNAPRKDPKHSTPNIPSLPISYADALPILQALNGLGPAADEIGKDWGGILKGVDYNVGPSELELNLYNHQNYTISPINNVIAKFEGILPDEVVIVGNHRDAWLVGGAGDPNSGTAVLLSFAKALGELKKKGWRPLRTIILANWDGEEYALLGSTEWGEDHAKYLNRKALAYINVDVAVSGRRFYAEASPSLNNLVREVTALIPHPEEEKKSLYDVWENVSGARIGTLGTGSDYTVFLDHLGIPSIDFGFNPGKGDPIYHYHSNYDSFHWMDNFVNESWAYHATAAKTMGLLTISLAQKPVIEFRLKDYGEVLYTGLKDLLSKHKNPFGKGDVNIDSIFFDETDGLLAIQRDRINNHNNHNNHNNRNDDYHHHEHLHEPTPESDPKKAIEQLKYQIDHFSKVAERVDKYSEKLNKDCYTDYPWWDLYKKVKILIKIKLHNWKLAYFERIFLVKDGLDGRTWFKHMFFAPNRYLGYGGALYPGLLEALEDSNPVSFVKWAYINSHALYRASSTFYKY